MRNRRLPANATLAACIRLGRQLRQLLRWPQSCAQSRFKLRNRFKVRPDAAVENRCECDVRQVAGGGGRAEASVANCGPEV